MRAIEKLTPSNKGQGARKNAGKGKKRQRLGKASRAKGNEDGRHGEHGARRMEGTEDKGQGGRE